MQNTVWQHFVSRSPFTYLPDNTMLYVPEDISLVHIFFMVKLIQLLVLFSFQIALKSYDFSSFLECLKFWSVAQAHKFFSDILKGLTIPCACFWQLASFKVTKQIDNMEPLHIFTIHITALTHPSFYS